jgi:pimeloyl-[acyl-carrier protein] methyl ester esterase
MEVLFLHALPLDGSMWADQQEALSVQSHAPTLYGFGTTMRAWAEGALGCVSGDRVVVVGCSVGGSCALELAALAPDRIAALVLIGTKVRHRPDPALHASALDLLASEGLEQAWRRFWEPLFSHAAGDDVIRRARDIALRQSPEHIAAGVSVFHTRPSRDQTVAGFPRPVVFVSGADDTAPGRQTTTEQAALAPGGRLHVIPDCGHYVPMERPELLNAILRDVLTALG